MSYKVSVIVPVYKVEHYVERCARSLFEQTFNDVEYIFVDDCTPDSSMQIVKRVAEEYPDRLDAVSYVYHEENKGLPSARNSGLAVATGEYVFHCDSDDWAAPTMIERMYRAAEQNGADVVYADWYLSFHRNERHMCERAFLTAPDCLKAILCGKMKFNVWNKLVRRCLYADNQISFPDGFGMGEDMTMIKLFCHARKVVHVNEAFYHYVQTNANAYTKTISEHSLAQAYVNACNVVDYIERMYGDALNAEIHCFKLNVKLPLLISAQKTNYETWLKWFPEANPYIGRSFSFRIRCVQVATLRRRFWLVKLHYYGIMKIVYGIIYR